jgi:cysteinyl-tRNA synthetase
MNFTEEAIAGAKSGLERLRRGYAILAGEIPNPTVPATGGEPASAYETRFFEALDDDLNTAGAAGVLFDMVSNLPRHPDPAERAAGAALLREALGLFGIAPLLERPLETDHAVELDPALVERLAARLGGSVHLNGDGPEAAVQAIIDARTAARKNKDFALGDRLRDALAAEGIVLKDSKDGTTWTVADA